MLRSVSSFFMCERYRHLFSVRIGLATIRSMEYVWKLKALIRYVEGVGCYLMSKKWRQLLDVWKV